jgi:hypothetical protein
MNDASSSPAKVAIQEKPELSAGFESLLLALTESRRGPDSASGCVVRSGSPQGAGTQPALTIASDSSSILQNARITQAVAPWVDYVTNRLDAIARDTELGLPSPEVINRARSWIMHLLPPGAPSPAVLPSEDGGIDFVWHRGGWNVEIGVEPGGTETVWTWNRESNEEVFGDLEEHRAFFVDLIRALSARD